MKWKPYIIFSVKKNLLALPPGNTDKTLHNGNAEYNVPDELEVSNENNVKAQSTTNNKSHDFKKLKGASFNIHLSGKKVVKREIEEFILEYIGYVKKETEYNRVNINPFLNLWWIIDDKNGINEEEFEELHNTVTGIIEEYTEFETLSYFFFISKKNKKSECKSFTDKFGEAAIIINHNNLFWNYDGYSFNIEQKVLNNYALNVITTIEECQVSLSDISWRYGNFSKEKNFFTIGTSRNLLYKDIEEKDFLIHPGILNFIKDVEDKVYEKAVNFQWSPNLNSYYDEAEETIDKIKGEFEKDYANVSLLRNKLKVFFNSFNSNMQEIEFHLLTRFNLYIINDFFRLLKEEKDGGNTEFKLNNILKTAITNSFQKLLSVNNFSKELADKIDKSLYLSNNFNIVKQFFTINDSCNINNLKILYPEKYSEEDITDAEDNEDKLSRFNNFIDNLYKENKVLQYFIKLKILQKTGKRIRKRWNRAKFNDGDNERFLNTILFQLVTDEVRKFNDNLARIIYENKFKENNLTQIANFKDYLTLNEKNIDVFINKLLEKSHYFDLKDTEYIEQNFEKLKKELYDYISKNLKVNNNALNINFDILSPLYSIANPNTDKTPKYNLIVINKKLTGAKEIGDEYKKNVNAEIKVLENFPFDEAKISIFGPWADCNNK